MTPNEKFQKWLEENNFIVKASVSIDHDNKVTAGALLHFTQLAGIKLTPMINILEKPKEEPKE